MWKSYGKDGVAIVSTVELLKDALRSASGEVFLGAISYHDFDVDAVDTDIPFPVAKRHTFSTEKELRIMMRDPTSAGIWQSQIRRFHRQFYHRIGIPENPEGRETTYDDISHELFESYVKPIGYSVGFDMLINLRQVITSVYIHPGAPPWIVNAIRLTLQSFGFDQNVVKRSEIF